MKRSTIFAVIAVCSMGAVATTVSAAELTNTTPTTAVEEAKMPGGVEFSNGPAGGGADAGTVAPTATGTAGGATTIGAGFIFPLIRRSRNDTDQFRWRRLRYHAREGATRGGIDKATLHRADRLMAHHHKHQENEQCRIF